LLSGLSRFDGAQFVNFDSVNTPELSNPGVRRLLVESFGKQWVSIVGNVLLLRQTNAFVKIAEDFQIASLVGVQNEPCGFFDAGRWAGDWSAWKQRALVLAAFKPPLPSSNPHFVEDD